FFWHDPASDRSLLGIGVVRHFGGDGPGDLAHVAREIRDATDGMAGLDQGGLVALGGFAFSEQAPGRSTGLPGCWFLLPRRLWRREGRTTRVIDVDAPSAPPPRVTPVAPEPFADDWHPRVASALDEIRRGSLDKVVLSRRRCLPRPEVPLRRVLRRLRDERPRCVTFAVRCGDTAFFGSTPEWMVRLDARGLHAPALAGTWPRGASPEADEAHAAALLDCLKNRREHRAVVDGVVASLRKLGIQPDVDEARILRLPEAMHLRTEIGGRVPAGLDVLRIAAELHPTPAVCGSPRAAAASFLRRSEADRGWYTGGVGWMDARGHGEVVVGLRSALQDGLGLTIHGGAGIVSGSDADTELAETELKMSALLDPLRLLAADGVR
ncbi:MAG: isochorismate synthase MenF, partial [Alphaproteobacteria bacterium]